MGRSPATPSKRKPQQQTAALRLALDAAGRPWLRVDDPHRQHFVEAALPLSVFGVVDLMTTGMSPAAAVADAEVCLGDAIERYNFRTAVAVVDRLHNAALRNAWVSLCRWVACHGIPPHGWAVFPGAVVFPGSSYGLGAQWTPGAPEGSEAPR